jgi:type II restriction enzyme
MNLSFETKLADKYVGQSQKIRVLTEHWVDNQIYCPNCGHLEINKYENNRTRCRLFLLKLQRGI